MFDDEPMAAGALAVLMPMAATPESILKWGIVNYVASYDEGCWLDGPDLADLTGVPWARRQLPELVRAKLLDVDDGGGGNRRWYRLNPRWWQWKVIWAHRCDRHNETPPPSLAACPTCRGLVQDRLEDHAARQLEHPVEQLKKRAGTRAFHRISARLAARFSEEEAPKRALGQTKSRGQSRVIAKAGDSKGPKSRGYPRDFPEAPEEEEITISAEDNTPPPTELDTADYGRARRALFAKAIPGRGRSKPGLWGRYKTHVRTLVGTYGIETFEAGCEMLDAGRHPVPVLIDQLADLLAVGLDPEGAAAVPAQIANEWFPSTSAVRLASLRQLIATYRSEGFEVPVEVQAEHDAIVERLEAQPDTQAATA